jgi:hypothetical protein
MNLKNFILIIFHVAVISTILMISEDEESDYLGQVKNLWQCTTSS